MASITQIGSQSEFSALIGSVDKLTLAHFWADWADQCKPVDEAIKILVNDTKLTNVNFVRVSAEEQSETSLEYEVAAVPTILFFTNGKLIERIEGAKVADMTKRVKELSTQQPRLAAKAKAASSVPAAASPAQPQKPLEDRIKELINAAPAMLFMKGSPVAPECGFSRTTVQMLNGFNAEYGFFDILRDNEIRQGLKEYSKWPTYPQLYVNGELVGGLDILKEMHEEGELEPMMPKKKSLEDRLKFLINQSPIMVFMKGQRDVPKCGFSKQLMEIFAHVESEEKTPLPAMKTFDILEDEEVRQGLKTYSNWPTFPQVYVKGELVGGLDIIKELIDSGDLVDTLRGN